MALALLFFLLGVPLLLGGAEALVQGAARLAAVARVPPVVVGLTVVSFGTSAPELAVVIGAALLGQPDVGVGNVIGSNIANVLLILGASAAMAPLAVVPRLLWLDLPLMIAASGLVYLLALDGAIGPLEGGLLFAVVIVYTAVRVVSGRRESRRNAIAAAAAAGRTERARPWPIEVLRILLGVFLLLLGARWLVDGAVAVARLLGVSELIVGLTVVAVGTSLPELTTSVLAAARGQRDIAVGNVIGSNLFNLLTVLGLGALVSAGGLPVAPAALAFDLPVMAATAVACLPIFFTGRVISRWEGALLLAYYVAYVLYLVVAPAAHDALPLLNRAMLYFVLPLTGTGLATLAVRAWREERGRAGREGGSRAAGRPAPAGDPIARHEPQGTALDQRPRSPASKPSQSTQVSPR